MSHTGRYIETDFDNDNPKGLSFVLVMMGVVNIVNNSAETLLADLSRQADAGKTYLSMVRSMIYLPPQDFPDVPQQHLNVFLRQQRADKEHVAWSARTKRIGRFIEYLETEGCTAGNCGDDGDDNDGTSKHNSILK